MTEDRILTTEEVAKMLAAARNIYLLQQQGILPRIMPPGRVRGSGIPYSAVLAFIQKYTQVSPTTGQEVAQ